MKIEIKTVEISVEELRELGKNNPRELRPILAQVHALENGPEPKLLPNRTTRARPRFNGKVPCPVCGLMYEARGIAVHFRIAHGKNYHEFVERRGEHSGQAAPLVPVDGKS